MQGAGNLNQIVTFQRAVPWADDYGNTVNAWADHLSVWADVRETTGKERVDAGRVAEARTATVRIRRSLASLGLTTADRMTYNGGIWNIRSIAEVGRDRAMLDLLVEIGVAS